MDMIWHMGLGAIKACLWIQLWEFCVIFLSSIVLISDFFTIILILGFTLYCLEIFHIMKQGAEKHCTACIKNIFYHWSPACLKVSPWNLSKRGAIEGMCKVSTSTRLNGAYTRPSRCFWCWETNELEKWSTLESVYDIEVAVVPVIVCSTF